METENELNAKITELTQKIRSRNPELSKLLDEMPLTIPNESSPARPGVHPGVAL